MSSFIINGVPLSHCFVNRPLCGVIIQILHFKLHLTIQALDSPWPSEPPINRNVSWLWSHNNTDGVLLFKIISQCALPIDNNNIIIIIIIMFNIPQLRKKLNYSVFTNKYRSWKGIYISFMGLGYTNFKSKIITT